MYWFTTGNSSTRPLCCVGRQERSNRCTRTIRRRFLRFLRRRKTTWLLSLPIQQIDLWLQLAPGYHRLQFTFPEGCTPIPVAPECLVQPYRTGMDCSLQTTPVKSDQELCISAGITALSISDAGSMS